MLMVQSHHKEAQGAPEGEAMVRAVAVVRAVVVILVRALLAVVAVAWEAAQVGARSGQSASQRDRPLAWWLGGQGAQAALVLSQH